ncbi:glutamine--fructose-6-phosphate transaminase (isomerizing) [Candidatus Woesearchaeota archaeon]|nr:glutamine--fructose-6-phosphate transaminase (isomerizing) [Candidatus Woesearchaeota archaeon]
MCGIVGYIGGKNAAPILLKGLKNLEYRGYDSAGIGTVSEKKVLIEKDIGKIDEVEKKVNLSVIEGNIGIAHSRWATHGAVTKENAHPHTDCSDKISIVHNGIIENYDELKKKLIEHDHKFKSETDTEVIVHLIEDYYKGDIREAVIKALKHLEGSYALGIICSEENKLIAARKESPLVIGVGDKEQFIASDIPAILHLTKNIIFLGDGEVAELDGEKVTVVNLEGKEVKKEVTKINWTASMTEKQGFEHFMLKEIHEQPRAIEETVMGRITNSDVNIGKELKLSDDYIRNIDRIIMVACGTSWHASIIGEFMLEELTGIPVEVEYASEFRYRNPIVRKNDLVIAISQSGETADTLAALREAKRKGAKILSVCNVFGSTIPRESDVTIYTHAGPEIGVASTKAFTCQLVVLYLITLHFGRIMGAIPPEQIKNRIRDLRKLPLQMQAILEEQRDNVELHAKKFYKKKNALYMGRGINYPIALEGALKLKEVSYIHAEGYPAAEMKHGPIALIDKDMPVVCIAPQDHRTYKKVTSNMEEVRSRGGNIIAIATKGDKGIKKVADHTFYIPENSYILTPVLAVIPLQLFAYYIARDCGRDIDKPRNLAKSVTVE